MRASNSLQNYKDPKKEFDNGAKALIQLINEWADTLSGICGEDPEKKACSVRDFDNQKNIVSDKIIKCRVQFKLIEVNGIKTIGKRLFTEKYKLKKYLEATNSLRKETEKYGTNPSKKTIGFIIVDNLSNIKKQAYPLLIDIKGVSSSTLNIPDFAPTLSKDIYSATNPDGRVFSIQTFQSNERGDDTEPRMLEEIARLYWKNNRKKVNLELFTDRETCGGCESLVKRINNQDEQTKDWITINTYDDANGHNNVFQGIFQASTSLNPNRIAEPIPLKYKNFYLNIN